MIIIYNQFSNFVNNNSKEHAQLLQCYCKKTEIILMREETAEEWIPLERVI